MPTTMQPPAKQTDTTIIPILVRLGYIKPDSLNQLPASQDNATIEDFLIRNKLVPPDAIIEAYAEFYKLPFVRLKSLSIKPAVVQRIPELIARNYDLVAYDFTDDILSIALATPRRLQLHAKTGLLHRLQKELGVTIAPAFAPLDDIRAAHQLYQQSGSTKKGKAVSVPTQVPSQPTSPPLPQSNGKAKLPVISTVSLASLTIPSEVLHKFPREVVVKYQLVPFEEPSPGYLKLAAVTPTDPTVQQLITFLKEKNQLLLDLYQTDSQSLAVALAQYDGQANPVPSSDRKKEQISRLTTEMAAKKIERQLGQSDQGTANQPSVETPSIQSSVPPATPPTSQPSPQPSPQPIAQPPTPIGPQPQPQPKPVAPPDQQAIPEIKASDITAESTQNLSLTQTAVTGNGVNPTNTSPANQASQGEAASGEKALDAFVGQPVASVNDLITIIRSGSVPKIVAATLMLAVDMRASDVHLESEKERLRLRYRIDGELVDILFLPKTLQAPIVSRIKILSQLKIDENRIPQDGRFDVSYRQREIDLRVSTLPAIHGEKVVMRILDKSTGVMSLKDMGIDGSGMKRLTEAVNKPYGIVLSTGPTGSGKSTTLYAILQQISQPDVNVVTLEDPVEYEIVGINQTQIKPKIGFTFAEGLRSILRQDPDIIMVGEIRDKETAEMATHAALTGHLVLSTLHTNTASGALPRLINMGIEPFLITSSLNVAVGQRLVRRVCSDCKYEEKLPAEVIEELKKDLASPNIDPSLQDPANWHFMKGKGCDKCNNGYRGRIGIFEVLVMSEAIENLGVQKAPASAIEAQAIKEGMITMKQDGLLKAIKGLTTLEEILKATTE